MLRTQIYLPYSQLRSLKRKAAEDGTSLSEILRRIIKEGVESRDKRRKNQRNAGDSLLAMARKAKRMGFRGPADLATNMDEYLYGGKK